MEIIKNNVGSYLFSPCENPKNKKGSIVFIHGFATTSEYHDVFIKYANKNYDYYALQLPGHGVEEKDKVFGKDKRIDLEKFTIYCCELIKSLNLGKFYLIGHSMGGGLSVRVASVLKNDVIALAAVTPMNSSLGIDTLPSYWKFNPKNFKKTLFLNNILYNELTKTVHEDKLEDMINKETEYQVKHRKFLIKVKKGMFSLANRKKCREYEKILEVPTLVIAGKYDKIITPKSLLKSFKNNQKDKEFIQIELFDNSAHLPFIEEQEKYAEVILNFFNDQQQL